MSGPIVVTYTSTKVVVDKSQNARLYMVTTPGPAGQGGTPGGTFGQLQFNNNGSFGGVTIGGDGTLNTATGALTVTKTGGVSFGPFATQTTSTGSGSVVLAVSPAFTGAPTAPTAAFGTNTTQLATTAFVIANAGGGGGSPGGSSGQVQYNNAGAFGGLTGFTTSAGALATITATGALSASAATFASLTAGGLVKSAVGGAVGLAVAGTDFQIPISFTTTGTSGASTFNTATGALNIPNYANTTYSNGAGLGLTGTTFSVNTSQNITTLSNLTVAGFVQTTSAGLLSSAALTSGQVTTALGFTPAAAFGSQTANFVYAAPNGSNGTPTFRAIVGADIPTLNQNTTGTAANITATSNSTLATLSSLSLPYAQLSGTVPTWNQNTTGNAATATSVPFGGLTAGSLFSGNYIMASTSTLTASSGGVISANQINHVDLSSLATGLLKNTATTGAPTIAVAGTDYQFPITFTTTGTGISTFVANALNIPNYAADTSLVTLTATQILTNKRKTPRVVTVADATSITPNSDNADAIYQLNTQSVGTLTVNADAGTPTNMQTMVLKFKCTNVQTFAFNAQFVGGAIALPTATTGGGKIDMYSFIYDAVNSKWQFVGQALGF